MPHAPPSPERRRFALGLMAAIGIGIVLGVGTWWFTLRPKGPQPVHYTVVRGDSLSRIAQRYGVEVEQVRSWNDLQGDRIDVGQVLAIYPGDPASGRSAGGTHRGTHRRHSGGTVRSVAGPGQAPSVLRMPAPQNCLAGPDIDASGDDPEMAASAGLSYGQTKAALDGFLGNLTRCVPPGGVDGTLDLRLTVGCDGRVRSVEAADSGGLPADLVGCVRETLQYVPFPPHDIADGFTFEYPLTFQKGD